LLGEGRVSIAAPEDVSVVEVGDPEGGQFQVAEEIKASRIEGRLIFRLDASQARGVVLLTSEAKRDHARQLMNAALQ
jgi:hypothetical protein